MQYSAVDPFADVPCSVASLRSSIVHHYTYLTFRGCFLVRGFLEEVRVEFVEFGCDGGL